MVLGIDVNEINSGTTDDVTECNGNTREFMGMVKKIGSYSLLKQTVSAIIMCTH